MLTTLAQRANDDTDLMVGLVVGAVAIIVITAAIVTGRRRNAELRRREQMALADQQRMGQVQHDRDEKAYSQHVYLNDLTGEKLQAETRVLHAQLAAMERDKIARERDEEYHRLMVQKAKLEIQSLQLHIREQRKRLDDFGSYDDE